MEIIKKSQKYFLLATYLLGCFPILTFATRSILIIVWSLLGIFVFFVNQKNYKFKNDIWIFVLPFLILIFSILYTANTQHGMSSLIKMVSFIIFPFIFYLNSEFFSTKQIYKILYFFVFSVFIIITYQSIQVILNYTFITDNITLLEIKSNGFSALNEISENKIDQIKIRRFRSFIIEISNTHTTYLGLWICFSIFFLGSELKKIKQNSLKSLIIVLIIILIFWLYLISARMPLLSLLISSLLTVIIFSDFSRIKLLKFGLILFAFLIAGLSFNNPISIRVKEYYDTGLTLLEPNSNMSAFNSSNVRNGIYYCDLKLIKKSPFFGVGVGDIQDELNKCYSEELGAKVYSWQQYNTHNQYAFFWISSGVIGFLLFVLLIYHLFKKAIKNKNFLFFYFICLTSLIFFTESLLERSDGLIFFSFFTSILYFNSLKK